MKNILTYLKVILIPCIVAIIVFGCKNEVSCSRCQGCTTINTRLIFNDSLIYDTTLCSYVTTGFSDTVTALYNAQQALQGVTVTRHDTTYDCEYATVNGKDAASLQSQGWYCQYRK